MRSPSVLTLLLRSELAEYYYLEPVFEYDCVREILDVRVKMDHRVLDLCRYLYSVLLQIFGQEIAT